jgi:hypothetical protein
MRVAIKVLEVAKLRVARGGRGGGGGQPLAMTARRSGGAWWQQITCTSPPVMYL